MWCPKCKNEYRPGFTHCPDCDVDLVESLDSLPEAIIFGGQEELTAMAAVLEEECGVSAEVKKSEEEPVYELFVPKDQVEEAREKLNAYLIRLAQEQEREENGFEDEEAEEAEGEDEALAEDDFAILAGEDEREEDVPVVRSYESKRSKATEYKASAGALLLVGVIGVVGVILLYLDKLPVLLSGGSKILICAVMGIMFLGFIVLGVLSNGSYKKLLAAAEEEEALIEKIKEYQEASLTRDYVDAHMSEYHEGGEELSGEQAYFPRMQVILKGMKEQFPEAEQALIEKMADDWYNRIYAG